MEEIWGFMVAGSDTMSTTLSWGVKETCPPYVEEVLQRPVEYFDAAVEKMLWCGGTIFLRYREAIVNTLLLGHHILKETKVRFLSNGPGSDDRSLR
ncbi:hypothetical protein F5B18DRAFT_672065 [Nemania serpens]|nr:hypothetical protein F5B18DRAFT_672065 [Nemania serpens]